MVAAAIRCPWCSRTEDESDFALHLDIIDGVVINADRGCPSCEHTFETEETKRMVGGPIPCQHCTRMRLGIDTLTLELASVFAMAR